MVFLFPVDLIGVFALAPVAVAQGLPGSLAQNGQARLHQAFSRYNVVQWVDQEQEVEG